MPHALSRFTTVGVIAVACALSQCASPTAIKVSVYTDVPCASNGQALIVGGDSLSSLAGKAPASASTRCALAPDGTSSLGDVYITPTSSSSSEVAFEVVLRPDGQPADGCVDPANAASCIVARRQIRFISHQELGMRVDLRTSCLGVTCSGDETCARGQCVSAQTACSGGSCDETVLLPQGGVSHLHRIAAGADHTCAITPLGGVKCWGGNTKGELGDGTNNESHVPVDVKGLGSGVISLATGLSTTCAMMSDRTLKCWGKNDNGQVGNKQTVAINVPADVAGFTDADSVSVGCKHTCASTRGGAAKCWGLNDHGQVGDDSTSSRSSATDVVGLQSGVAMVTNGFDSTCAVLSGGAKCWGDDVDGQLGDGNMSNALTPVNATVLPFVPTLLTAGAYHVFAYGLDPTGAPLTAIFGKNAMTGGITGLPPHAIEGAGAGNGYTCVLQGGGVLCWGQNDLGQLGNGTTVASQTPVAPVGLDSGVAEIAAGFGHACALATDGKIKCWGENGNGELGNGTTAGSKVPVDVTWP